MCIARKMSMYLTPLGKKLSKEFPGVFIPVLELQTMNLKYFSGILLFGLEKAAYTKAHTELSVISIQRHTKTLQIQFQIVLKVFLYIFVLHIESVKAEIKFMNSY